MLNGREDFISPFQWPIRILWTSSQSTMRSGTGYRSMSTAQDVSQPLTSTTWWGD